jgi:hypothetical protein
MAYRSVVVAESRKDQERIGDRDFRRDPLTETKIANQKNRRSIKALGPVSETVDKVLEVVRIEGAAVRGRQRRKRKLTKEHPTNRGRGDGKR